MSYEQIEESMDCRTPGNSGMPCTAEIRAPGVLARTCERRGAHLACVEMSTAKYRTSESRSPSPVGTFGHLNESRDTGRVPAFKGGLSAHGECLTWIRARRVSRPEEGAFKS